MGLFTNTLKTVSNALDPINSQQAGLKLPTTPNPSDAPTGTGGLVTAPKLGKTLSSTGGVQSTTTGSVTTPVTSVGVPEPTAIESITVPNVLPELPGGSGIKLTVPDTGTEVGAGELTKSEQQLKSGLMVGNLNPLTAANQEAQNKLMQQVTQANYAPEVKTAVLNNLLAAQNTDVLKAIQDVNNTAYGWVKTREDGQQAENTQLFYTLWDAGVGTGNEQAILDMGAELGVDPALLRSLAENPDAYRILGDKNRNEIKTYNAEQAGNFINTIDTEADPAGSFKQWLDLAYANDAAGLSAEAFSANLSEEDWASFEQAYGQQDRENADTKTMAYAWKQFNDKIDAVKKAEKVNSISEDIQAMGYSADPTTVDQITKMVDGMSADQIDQYLQNLSYGPDGELSPDGVTSIYFFDWNGKPITTADEWTAYQNDTTAQGLNKLWLAYTEATPTANQMSRKEFLDMYGAMASAADITASDITTMDAARQAMREGLTANTQTLIYPTDIVKTAPSYITTTQLLDLASDPDWWNANSVMPSKPPSNLDNRWRDYEGDGTGDWKRGSDLALAYRELGWMDSALVTVDGNKYKIVGNPIVERDDSGWNSYEVYYNMVDLGDPTGAVKKVHVGSHDAN